jgi:hypothetical protein
MAKRYAALGLLTGPALPVSLPALWLARAVVAQRRKPEFVESGARKRLRQSLDVAAYLALVDAATWAGWVRWLRSGAARSEDAGAASEERAGG